MNTNSKYRKISLVVLAVVLIAFLAMGAWLSSFMGIIPSDYGNSTDAVVSKTADTSLFTQKPYVVAETEELAIAYAQKLGLEEGQYIFADTSVLKVDSNGTWIGMEKTTCIYTCTHLLLPNNVKKIAINREAATGITSVRWVSITANTGSQLAEFERGTANTNAVFGNGGGWLERVDLTKATNLRTIPSYTFYGCDRLYDIALPDTLTSIEANAIASSGMVHISLPSGLGDDGSGLNNDAFKYISGGNSIGKIVEIELPSNANTTFENKVKAMTSVSTSYLNVYKKGTGRSWLVTTSDGFIFCKNILRTSPLATQMGSYVTVESVSGRISYATNKWYLVGYRGPESGGDALLAAQDYMVRLPEQVDLAVNSEQRKGAFDYIDCTGAEIQNDFSSLAGNTTTLGSNVAINGSSRVIAGTSGETKMRYDVGQRAFYYRWVWHTTIPDNAVLTIGDYAFNNAPMTTFNCGNVEYIGDYGLRFSSSTQADLIFYAPSPNPNPFCSANGFITENNSYNRVFVYRNYSDYSNRATPPRGLYARMRDYGGTKKFYTYLVDIEPNVAEWDSQAGAYKYTAVDDEKIQRLYAGSLSGYNGALYANPYCFERQSNDTWKFVEQSLPSLTGYTGYSKTSWFTSTDFNTKYTETSIGTADNNSTVISLRNAASKATDKINMYAKKIVTRSLTDKVREYTDSALLANDPQITGIPGTIKDDYTVEVLSYVDSSGNAKSFESIGSVIQEAGVYTLQIQPDAYFGEWDSTEAPIMTVEVKKTTVNLIDFNIFRLGVTTNGVDRINLRPGKEVEGEQGATLYKYNNSWYTDEQTDLGDCAGTKEELWNSFVRAEGENLSFSLVLVSSIVKDAHDSSKDIFTCDYSNCGSYNESGEYNDVIVLTLTEEAKNNYRFVFAKDDKRQLIMYPDESQTEVTITKTWYIVKLNNWLTYEGESGNDARSYNMKSEWEFGSTDLPSKPAAALGNDVSITFNLELTSQYITGGSGSLVLCTDTSIADFDDYFNSSMPVGKYRIIYKVSFYKDDNTKYDTFQQSFAFEILEKQFTAEESAAINQIQGMTFEYDMDDLPGAYNQVLFDLSKLADGDNKTKLKDMLALDGGPQWNTKRKGIWLDSNYDNLFESNYTITYNLNRMWTNEYRSITPLLRDYQLDQPDVYIIYYQLTCKNRQSLINPNNNDRRLHYFNVVVYRTLTAPQGITDIAYTGEEIYPTISYLNGELEFERAYYEASFPSNQDNVNHGDKKVILTISPENTQLYRWEKDASKNVVEIPYKIVAANNSTTIPLYMAGWSWNSTVTLDDIVWGTRFGNAQDYKYTLVPVKTDNDDREELTDITKFGMASAGDYNLVAYCPADVNGNWKEFEQSISIRVHQAGNSWVKSPSISTWTWNQYANFDWNASGAVSPIEIHAIPTYFASPKETGEQPADGWGGTGRFDFRIYSIDSTKTGNDMYNVVEFDNGDFHFQYATDAQGNFLKNGDHFVLPISVAKKLAGLPAGRYYLVATVYSHNNYSGLNNSSESFVQGAVPFTIASANNVWTNTITANDWAYSQFQMGYNLNAATAKYDTQLTYSVCTGKTTEAAVVNGIKLENIKSTSDVAPGTTYTYAQLINMLNVGEYTLRVHGDQSDVNERGGINYLAIDDQREFRVTKAANTLTQNFAVFNYTIGTSTTDLIPKYTARFDSENVGYRISQNGSYVDGLSAATTTDEPIKITKSLTYAQFLTAIAGLKSTESGSNYSVWWTTSDGTNYEARSGLEVITVYLGQNSWLNDKVPTIEDWEYDGTEHEFDLSIIKLTHSVDLNKINLTYYNANFNEYTGQYTRGAALDSCPIDVGNYIVAVNVPSDDYYKGMSTDLFFRITAASNKFKTLPSVKNGGWIYSQLATGDIVICAPEHEEDNMMLTYVVYKEMGGGNPDERVATLQWELGDGFNNNDVVLEAFYARLNSFDVGAYKLYASVSASNNYKQIECAPISFSINKASNGWKEGKTPVIGNKNWEWDNYVDGTWKDVETKFGNVTIYVNNNAVAMLSIPRYLSELGVGNYTMRFEVAGTNNYNSFTDSVTFEVKQNSNGWKDGESDATAFVHGWTWGEYNNDIAGGNPTWVEPAPKYGTPYASIYKGKDGVGGSAIGTNIALYSLDIVMNFLDAGDYYMIWSIAESANYGALTRPYINFKVDVNPNAWDPNKIADMHENDNPTVSEGIQYGWTWGEYGKDGGQYFTMPQAKFGTTVAKLTKVDKKTGAESIVFDGVSNELSIANVLANLDASRYILRWSAVDLQNSGNYKEIQYSKEFKFIINMGVNSWTGDAPQISDWMWGEFKSTYWKAPGLTHGTPVATVTRIQPNGNDGEIIANGILAMYLNAQLESLGVGKYRLEWSSNSEGNFEISEDDPDPLEFEVFVNANGWVNAPAITAPDSKWQWGLFTLGYWTMPSAKYHNNDLFASVYKVNGDYIYDVFNKEYDFSNCVERDEITLDTIDRINDLSVGKYLIKVGVPKDTMGRYRGLEAVVPFEIVPNENKISSVSYYVNSYAYQEFRGYWRAPMAQYGEIMASIYSVEDGKIGTKLFEVSTFDLSDVLRELHTGDYQLDWTIVEDEEGNYLSHTRTSKFSVTKANNRWLSRPTIRDWAYGLYDTMIAPTAMPLIMSDNEQVYYKILDGSHVEIAQFRAYADKFTKDANGNSYDNGRLVLTADGYFTDITMVGEVVSGLKPGIYHLMAYYPELADYNRLDTNNDHLFEIRSIENRWIELPTIKSWVEGSTASKPQGSALHGKVTWTYYRAVYDNQLGKYRIDGTAIATGENPPEDAGKYILVASTEIVDIYSPLREEIFFEVFEKSLTGVSGNLLLWIDISLATIASITAAVIIYTLQKARRRKDDDVFNG